MFEWEVVEEEPAGGAGLAHTARPWWRRIVVVGALLLLAALAAGALLFWSVERNEARRQADLQRFIHLEEQAYRFGLPDQAEELVIPNAPEEWLERYRSALNGAQADLPEAVVEAAEYREREALVTLDFGGQWRTVRYYQLQDGAWKRGPVPPSWWGESRAYTSENLTIHLSDRDLALLDPDTLLAELEGLRSDLLALWPETLDRPIEIRVQPLDLYDSYATGRADRDVLHLAINSPLLVPVDGALTADPGRAYRYALALAVAEIIAPTSPPNELWAAFQKVARSTLVRRRTLTEVERRAALRALVLEAGSDWSRRSDGFVMDALKAAYLADGAGEALLVDYAFDDETRRRLNDPVGVPSDTLPLVADRAILWGLSALDLAEELPEVVRGQAIEILEVTRLEPLRARVLLNGIHIVEAWEPPAELVLPVEAACLGPGSLIAGNFTMRADPARPVSFAEPFQLVRHLFPIPETRLAAGGWQAYLERANPAMSRLAVSQSTGSGTRLQMVDVDGNAWPLLELPPGRQIAAHPTLPFFAFLDNGPCGPSVTLARPTAGQIERVPIQWLGDAHLVWAENWLFLFDQVPGTEEQESGWDQSVLFGGTTLEQSEPLRRRLPALSWKEIRGYDRDLARLLLEDASGRLWWLFPFFWPRPSVAALEPVLYPLPPAATSLSLAPNGRWHLLSQPQSDGSTALFIQNLLNGETQPLDPLPAGQRYAAVSWTPTRSVAFLAAVEGAEGANALHRYELFSPARWDRVEERRTLDQPAEALHWCGANQLYYQPAGTDRLVAIPADGEPPLETTGTLIWCR